MRAVTLTLSLECCATPRSDRVAPHASEGGGRRKHCIGSAYHRPTYTEAKGTHSRDFGSRLAAVDDMLFSKSPPGRERLNGCLRFRVGWRGAAQAAGRETPARRGAVERAVDPLGTVVVPLPARRPPQDDADAHTSSNADEGTFRPVLRAPAALPAPPPLLVRPLPRTTTIPVQSVAAPAVPACLEPSPLTTVVLIPAALTAVDWRAELLDLPDSSPDDPSARDAAPGVPGAFDAGDRLLRTLERHDRSVELPSVPKRSEEKRMQSPARVDAPPRGKIASADRVKRSTTSERDGFTERSKFKADETFDRHGTPVRPDTLADESSSKPRKDKFNEQKDARRNDKPAKQKTVEDTPPAKTTEPVRRVADDAATSVDNSIVDIKRFDVNKDLKRQESDVRKRESARDRGSAECAERESDDSKSLPKSNRPSDDIQPTARARVKKSPTPKSVSDRDSEVSIKDNESKRVDEPKDVKEPTVPRENREVKEQKEIKKQKDIREPKGSKELKESNELKTNDERLAGDARDSIKVNKEDKKEHIVTIKDEIITSVTLKPSVKKETETKPLRRMNVEIKTEEQAWDMLLNEPEKPVILSVCQQATIGDKNTEDKPKIKKNRKLKKTPEDSLSKEDDSFVEIHAIEDKQQCSGDLVSISDPFDDLESSTYLSKTKKRGSKSLTLEKKDDCEILPPSVLLQYESDFYKPRSPNKYDDVSDIEVLPDTSPTQLSYSKMLKVKKHTDGTASESSSFFAKESPRPGKSKSLSPYTERRKADKPAERVERREKDVYVIDTAGEEFPVIQITRGAKPRKRSPQPIECKVQEMEVDIEKPAIKSWSSIAASKNVKKGERDVEVLDKKFEGEETRSDDDDNPVSSTSVSLQDKLYELCKRTDIMVAECDAPNELNFVEEHHAVLHDLPPLEPLDFGLDDFKLEVMRDSLLDVNDTKLTSPICKISIDDILSSIKETTSKVIESSSFNLIDLEKVPAKREKGYSVIESHKITSQEVKLDDDTKDEMMEKSSDDDNTSPVTSTDSDKEDKKSAGASNLVTPSSKQSAKSKKSRRKKK